MVWCQGLNITSAPSLEQVSCITKDVTGVPICEEIAFMTAKTRPLLKMIVADI